METFDQIGARPFYRYDYVTHAATVTRALAKLPPGLVVIIDGTLLLLIGGAMLASAAARRCHQWLSMP